MLIQLGFERGVNLYLKDFAQKKYKVDSLEIPVSITLDTSFKQLHCQKFLKG
jgi:hypothetical protein